MRHTALLTTALLISAAFAPAIAYAQSSNGQPSPATTAPSNWPSNPSATGSYTSASVSPNQAAALDSVGDAAIPALPLDVQSSNGVTYITGGIGDEEVAELKSKAGEFNLHVMLTSSKGEYISDVNLQIADAKGTQLVSADNAGPYLYAHLKPGKYVLQTHDNSDGMSKKINVTVPAKGTAKENIVFSEVGGITTSHTPTTKLE